MSDFHGWSVKSHDKTLYVGPLPGRKQVCLYVLDGSTIRTLAFFQDSSKARDAVALIDAIARTTGFIEEES